MSAVTAMQVRSPFMSDRRFRKVFSRGTSLKDAWRACGVEVKNPINAPWHAWRDDGTLVITVWRDHPDAGRWALWVRSHAAVRLALRKPADSPEESKMRVGKLLAKNEAIRKAAQEQRTIVVLVLNWKRDANGRFVDGQRGASVPVEAWSAWIGEVHDAGSFACSVVATWQSPRNPFEAQAVVQEQL